MSRRFASVFLTCLLAGSAWSQTIQGPGTVPEHMLGRFSVADLPDNTLVWWVLTPDDNADYEADGSKVVVTGKPGSYRLRALIAILEDGKPPRQADLRHAFTIHSTSPDPDPDPDPDDPGPVDPPPPVTRGVSRVVVFYETGSNLTAAQIATLNDPGLRSYLSQIVESAGDGLPAWKVWDKDVNTQYASPDWQTAVSKITIPSPLTEPVVFVFDDAGNVSSFPLPGTPDATIAELRKREGR